MSASYSGQVPAGRSGSCASPGGCSGGSDMFAISFPQVAGGYAHLFTPNVGFLVGGQLLTMRDQRLDEWYGAASLIGYVAVQNELAVLGIGFDIGAGSLTAEVAAEVTPWRLDDVWELSFAIYGRRTMPWNESAPPGPGGPADFNPRVWSFDVGARVTFGFVFVQYGYFHLDRGFVWYEGIGGGTFTEGLHVVTIGCIGDGRAFTEN